MLDQLTFDRSEEIAEALHEQDGLEAALIATLGDCLPADIEKVVFALIGAQRHCRNRANALATNIARSGAS